MDRERHIRLLAWLWVIHGLLLTLYAVTTLIAHTLGGIFSGHLVHAFVGPLVGLILAFVSFLFALPSLAVGTGLLGGKSWSRILAMILGVLAFPIFPLGTALCVYTFWTLWGREADAHFEGRHPTYYEYER